MVTKYNCFNNEFACPIYLKSSPQNIYVEINPKTNGQIVFEAYRYNFASKVKAIFEITFSDMSTGKPLATKSVTATIYNPVHENVTINSDYDDKTSSNVDLTLDFKPRYLVPILIKNRHSYSVKGTCLLKDSSIIQTIEYSCSLPGGSVKTDEGYYTELQFLDDYSGPSSFEIEYVFTELNGSRNDTKTLTVYVNG